MPFFSATTIPSKAIQSINNNALLRVWVFRRVRGFGLFERIVHFILPLRTWGTGSQVTGKATRLIRVGGCRCSMGRGKVITTLANPSDLSLTRKAASQ